MMTSRHAWPPEPEGWPPQDGDTWEADGERWDVRNRADDGEEPEIIMDRPGATLARAPGWWAFCTLDKASVKLVRRQEKGDEQ